MNYQMKLPVSLQIGVVSVAVGFAIGYMVLPATWFIFSYSFSPGAIEKNFCPGASIDNLIAALVAGIIAMFIYAIHGSFLLFGKK